MPEVVFFIIYIVGSYLLGSLPQMLGLAKVQNLQLEGDRHLTLWKSGSKWLALTGILLEFTKAVLAVLLGKYWGFDIGIVSLAGLAVVCGQMWPIFQKFDGEKGNTVGLAMAGALTILPLLYALIPIAAGAGFRTLPRIWRVIHGKKTEPILGGSFSQSLPLGMMGGFLVLPLAAWLLGEPWQTIVAYVILIILLLIRRLTAGITSDLAVSRNIKQILIGRLLYDRGISDYRRLTR